MKKHPPHLPPKSCSIPLYRRFMLSSSLVIITLIALASGIVGGIVADVYFSIDATSGSVVIRGTGQQTKIIENQPDSMFVREQYRRTVTLVARDEYENTGVLPLDGAPMGVLLTDTGWFVSYMSDPLPAQDWIAVSATGDIFEIDQLTYDAETGLTYGSLLGNGFRVAPFPQVSALTPDAGVWAMTHGTLAQHRIGQPVPIVQQTPVYLGEPLFSYMVDDLLASGTLLWTPDGSFFGFVTNDHAILPWFVVESTYIDVFSGNTFGQQMLPLTGYAVRLTEQQSQAAGGADYGWYVEQVTEDEETVHVGDIITQIAGSDMLPWTVDGAIQSHIGERIPLTVLREQTRLDLSIAKIVR